MLYLIIALGVFALALAIGIFSGSKKSRHAH